jgi:MFS family permease
MYASGSIIGLLVGATIAEQSGWRTTFLSIIPIAIMLPIVVWKFVKIGNVHPDWKVPSSVDSSLTQKQQQPRQYVEPPKDKKNDERRSKSTEENSKRSLDILGALTLAATITLFLLTLTFIETTSASNLQSISQLTLFSIACVAAFIAFIIVERRSDHPLIAFKLLQNKILFFANVMMIILGFSMFMIFQTIPILAESPRPAGFGDDITGAAAIQIPYSIILLIFGPTAGYVVSKLGSIRPAIMGYVINAVGFFIIAAFHSQAWMVSVGLAIISTGLSLGSVGLMNIVLLATPYRNMVTSIGMTTLLRIVGSAVGPAVAGVLMQLHQVSIPGYAVRFPSPESYTVIFLMAAAMSTVSIMMTLKIRQSLKNDNMK